MFKYFKKVRFDDDSGGGGGGGGDIKTKRKNKTKIKKKSRDYDGNHDAEDTSKKHNNDDDYDDNDDASNDLSLARFKKHLYERVAAEPLRALSSDPTRTDLTLNERAMIKTAVDEISNSRRKIVDATRASISRQRVNDITSRLRDMLSFAGQAKRDRAEIVRLHKKLEKSTGKTTKYVDEMLDCEAAAGDDYLPLMNSFLNPSHHSSTQEYEEMYEAFTDPYDGGVCGQERRVIYQDIIGQYVSKQGEDKDVAAAIMNTVEQNKPLDRTVLVPDMLPEVPPCSSFPLT